MKKINFPRGLNATLVTAMSAHKGEPAWMLEWRLNSLKLFLDAPKVNFGPNLSRLNLDRIRFYKPAGQAMQDWDKVPKVIKDTFAQLGIINAEQEYLGGVATQYESDMVYHNMREEVAAKGVIFCDMDTALREHEALFRQYFSRVVPQNDNKYALLNNAVWSGGSFIYVPKGVILDQPLQSYFRINERGMGQFERTLIIVDEGAQLHYIEGCTAPTYSRDALHAAVVEIIVHKNAKCRYTTIQNWSNNVYNLVTKRAVVHENGLMEWIDGNLGSKINMKYPACILKEPGARGVCISIAVADGKGRVQDAGAKMIHLAPNTHSQIISKSIASHGGTCIYRGRVYLAPQAKNAKSHVECDSLIIDAGSKAHTYPSHESQSSQAILEHEARVSKISEAQLFYLMSRGLTKTQASMMIILGFIAPFAKELPLEYAVELNRLLQIYFN